MDLRQTLIGQVLFLLLVIQARSGSGLYVCNNPSGLAYSVKSLEKKVYDEFVKGNACGRGDGISYTIHYFRAVACQTAEKFANCLQNDDLTMSCTDEIKKLFGHKQCSNSIIDKICECIRALPGGNQCKVETLKKYSQSLKA